MSTPLPPNQQLVKSGHWPYVGEREPAPHSGEWTLEVLGWAAAPRVFTLTQLQELPQVRRAIDIHCVTRWSMLDRVFTGVLLSELLAVVGVAPNARFVSFGAHSLRQHATSLFLAEALELGTLLAWEVDDQPLPRDHGGPLRSIVPGRYFYKSIKWLRRIELLERNRLGFWEATAGYHDHADPWREERYVASDVDRRLARQLIESRDFTGRDLRGIDCRDRQLEGLAAHGALLRNADFAGAELPRADFRGANLSNARFAGADLRQANFAGADLEGADFSNADLRGADLRGCSFFGASFCGNAADSRQLLVDRATQIDDDSLHQLTPGQRSFLQKCRTPPDPGTRGESS